MATNRERLAEAKIVKVDEPLTAEQETAIESLTSDEVDALISVKNKTAEAFPEAAAGPPIGICQHFN